MVGSELSWSNGRFGSNRDDWNLIRSNASHNFHGFSGNLRLLGSSQKQAYA